MPTTRQHCLIFESDRRKVTLDDAARRAAIERTRGAVSGAYEPGYLKGLRREWPA